MSEPQILWTPSEDFVEQSNLKAYQRWLEEKKGLQFADYQEIWQWSVDRIDDFWQSLWEYFNIIHHTPYESVLSGSEMPGFQWFKGATLNYTEHIFRHKSNGQPAIIYSDESGEILRVSWSELEGKVRSLRSFLESKGVASGDRVVAYMPNNVEALVSFYAVNSLGAVWSCCSPDFGVSTVIDRFQQIEPKLLITTDGYHYGGNSFDRTAEVTEIRNGIPSLEDTILVPSGYGSGLDDSTLWNEILQNFSADEPLEFAAVPFDHPIWVLYSSGTTGKPKAITHSHGGVLLEHLKYMTFHNDVHQGENFFWYTTTGWMMWNFLQASLLVGATAVLYDGSPGYPGLNALWKLTETLPIHHFGTSAPYLTACMKRDLHPGEELHLSSLRSIGSTGAPLPPEAFEWIYQSVSDKVWLCSMSGGTDVCTAFVGGCPYEPVSKGLIQCRALGCKLQAYDEDGEHVVGSLGEMVIEEPMPSMPIFFWNDEGNERYTSSYFEKFPGKWCHGDWINLRENGSLTIHGRSDATLNRKGIRIGTSEIYSALDGVKAVKDSLILNLEKSDGSDIMPLFVVMEEGRSLDTEIKQEISQQLKEKCSPRHVPDVIIQTPDLPYTLSGKKMEVPVKRLLLGMTEGKAINKDSIRNPEAMDHFKKEAPDFRKQYLN